MHVEDDALDGVDVVDVHLLGQGAELGFGDDARSGRGRADSAF